MALNPNDWVLRRAKRRAARERITFTKFVEDAQRAQLASAHDDEPFQLRLEIVTGNRTPNVDTPDRDALYDFVDRT